MTGAPRGRRSSAFGAAADGTCWGEARPLMLVEEAKKLGVLASDSVRAIAHLTILSLRPWTRSQVPGPGCPDRVARRPEGARITRVGMAGIGDT